MSKRSARFFNLTYYDSHKKDKTGKQFRVRKSSIDMILKKAEYTTLFIGGVEASVCEDADWIQNVCEMEDE